MSAAAFFVYFILGLCAAILVGFGILLSFAGRKQAHLKLLAQAIENFPDHSFKPASSTLKILTYNIGYASGCKNNQGCVLSEKEVEENLKSIAEVIQKSDADLVCLQEVDFGARRTFQQNQIEKLQTWLNFPSFAYAQTWNRRYLPWPWPPKNFFGPIISGQAVLSRFPILNQKIHPFPKPGNHSALYNHFYLERIAQELEIAWGEKKITLFNVHLEAFDAPTRKIHFEKLADIIEKNPSAYKIAAGDFNLASGSQPWSLPESRETLDQFEEKSKLQRAQKQESQATFPSWKPQETLDYIFASANFKIESGKVFTEYQGSDHLPLQVELKE